MNRIAGAIRNGVMLFTVICLLGVVYTLFLTWGTHIIMPDKADGSLMYMNGKVVGSDLIGQSFVNPSYFHGRPSAVNYAGNNSGGSNYGATSAALMEQVSQRIDQVRLENNLPPNASVPADLVLASGSGLDPHISVKGAMLQVPRISKARGLPESELKRLVDKYTEPLQFGFLGQERVNVLKLNLGLDEISKRRQ